MIDVVFSADASGLREAVAAAIYEKRRIQYADRVEFSELFPEAQHPYLDEADAAIVVMRSAAQASPTDPEDPIKHLAQGQSERGEICGCGKPIGSNGDKCFDCFCYNRERKNAVVPQPASNAYTPLAALVREWRDAQKAIDETPVAERQHNKAPLDRLIAAHNALVKYADEEMG